jgi:predicted dehydrogenase
VSDVDARRIKAAQVDVERLRGTTPEGFRDFRGLLARSDVAAVIVATPDHWHALVTLAACRAGKDVYCEAPLVHNLQEAVLLKDTIDAERIVQVGMTSRSTPAVDKALELIQNGALGHISRVEVAVYGDDFWKKPLGLPADTTAPAELDYDLWLGPAPKKPFNPKRCHTYWRWFFDYGMGQDALQRFTLVDLVQRALALQEPRSITSVGGTRVMDDLRTTYDHLDALIEYDGNVAVRYTYDCTTRAALRGVKPGATFHGTNGSLRVDAEGYEWLRWTDGQAKGVASAPVTEAADANTAPAAATRAHVDNFLQSVRTRQAPVAPVASVFSALVACHLTNLSLKVGRQVQWDAGQQLCIAENGQPDAEANALLGRDYRTPWQLPVA